ncbi:MAG: FAD:protein FMN transferase [Clostridia bacterium]|nr:FAD:protein FMN transferase [Clostridia bacterium]
MKKYVSLILVLCVILLSFCSCSRNVYPLSSTQIMMDTVVTIRLYDGTDDVLSGAMKLCKRYENLLSRTVEDSDIYKINHSNGQPVEVSDDTAELLRTALDIAEKSNGAFDPTVLPLVELWDVTNSKTVPPITEIQTALQSVGYKSVVLNGNTVTLKNGARLDLGGIAKGFIADKLKIYLKENGVKSAIINLGGNTLLVGDKNGNDFSVGVQKPFGKQNELSATVYISDKTAVTSGVYQRYFEQDGKIYHHIIDPKTGHPTDNGISAVTVLTDSSTIADGLSTACLILGIEKGTELAKQYGAELIFIDESGKITLTNGLNRESDNQDIIIKFK